MGFVLLLVVVVFVAYAFLKAKARRHYANQAGALRDVAAGPTGIPPSWVTNKDRLEEVFNAFPLWAARKGMPESYLVASFNHPDTFQTVMEFAGAMEQRGASFTEQQVAISDILFEMWKRLDADAKRAFTETVLQRK